MIKHRTMPVDIRIFSGAPVVLCLRHDVSEAGPRADHHEVESWPAGSTPYGYYAPEENILVNAKKSGPTIC